MWNFWPSPTSPKPLAIGNFDYRALTTDPAEVFRNVIAPLAAELLSAPRRAA